MITKVQIPHTCGEWLQGTLSGKDFLISCPIGDYSEVIVEIKSYNDNISSITGRKELKVQNDIQVIRPEKAIKAVKLFLNKFNIPPLNINIDISSSLPQGKGYGTSSADIYGSIVGICQFLYQNQQNQIGSIPSYIANWDKASLSEMAGQIAVKVEPSDSNCFDGLVKMNHLTGKLEKTLGTTPLGYLAILDLGGSVDTEDFNANTELNYLNSLKESELSQAYEMFIHGINTQDLTLMGKASSKSAQLHQQIIPKPEIDELMKDYPSADALGVVRAHSGNVAGLIYPDNFEQGKQSFLKWYQTKNLGSFVGFYPLVNGGIRRH